ncbi:MAG: hypothetical protein ACI9KE_002570 [Polyangiales bacterium]|jgi:hypothetical protein
MGGQSHLGASRRLEAPRVQYRDELLTPGYPQQSVDHGKMLLQRVYRDLKFFGHFVRRKCAANATGTKRTQGAFR